MCHSTNVLFSRLDRDLPRACLVAFLQVLPPTRQSWLTAARILREVGWLVSANVLVRKLGLLEVVVAGLPLF